MAGPTGAPNQHHPPLEDSTTQHFGIESTGSQIYGFDSFGDGVPERLVAQVVVEHWATVVLPTEGGKGSIHELGRDQVETGAHEPVTVPAEQGAHTLVRSSSELPEEMRRHRCLTPIPPAESLPI